MEVSNYLKYFQSSLAHRLISRTAAVFVMSRNAWDDILQNGPDCLTELVSGKVITSFKHAAINTGLKETFIVNGNCPVVVLNYKFASNSFT